MGKRDKHLDEVIEKMATRHAKFAGGILRALMAYTDGDMDLLLPMLGTKVQSMLLEIPDREEREATMVDFITALATNLGMRVEQRANDE